jgi:tRNA(Ile)-lysidine synthetase-like protein
MDLLPDFERKLAAHVSLKQGDRAVVGVSGGPDSLALLHLFVRARERLGILPHAVHLNHRIRGSEADEDAQAVAATAAQWNVPCTVEQMDVPALASSRRQSLEEAARQARYTVLGQIAVRLGARVIAVAHNADDQAETVLMHLLRGAGLIGLRGMLPVSPLSNYHLLAPLDAPLLIFRPLLDVPRADIEAYCITHGLSPRFDHSNLDTSYFRNLLRQDVFPVLETINPNVRTMLTRTASVLSAYYDVVKQQIDATCERITIESTDRRIGFDLVAWRALPLALQRATVRRAARHLQKDTRDVSFQHVEDAVAVGQRGETGAQATLPGGLTLRVSYDRLVIVTNSTQLPPPDWPLLAPGTTLPIQDLGEYDLPGSEWTFSLQPYEGPREGPEWESLLSDPWMSCFDADLLTEPLVLRTRRPGDRFFPLGLGGTQKVSVFMINEKIPAEWRDHLPFLVMADQIVWVCGWRVDQRFAVRPDTSRIWMGFFTPNRNE